MNFYHSMNQIFDYIDTHLTSVIDYTILSRFLGVNSYTMEWVFSLVCSLTLTEYVRNRRLSVAFDDLFYGKERIIDVALRYGYENPTSFSRAFFKFHGVKPSEVKRGCVNHRNYPKLYFDEFGMQIENMEYSIQNHSSFTLYGKGVKTNKDNINQDAPKFFDYMRKTYHIEDYGMVVYEDRDSKDNYEYWVLSKEKKEGLERYDIPKSTWLIFRIHSRNAKDIQMLSHQFLNTHDFRLRNIPDLEVYDKNFMEFWIPIE